MALFVACYQCLFRLAFYLTCDCLSFLLIACLLIKKDLLHDSLIYFTSYTFGKRDFFSNKISHLMLGVSKKDFFDLNLIQRKNILRHLVQLFNLGLSIQF